MRVREKEQFAYDMGFQERIVRVLVEDPDWCMTTGVPHLGADLFENNVHRWFADTTIRYAKKHASGISVSALKIESDRAYVAGRLIRKRDKVAVDALLKKLRRKPVADRSYIQSEVFRYIKTQTYKRAVLTGADLIKQGKIDAIDSELQRVLDVQALESGGLGHFMLQQRAERYKRRKEYVPDGLPTGFECDKYMKGGGLRKKQLGAFIAAPAVGKTNHLVQAAKQAVLLGQKPILYITLELSTEVIQDRMDASFTGIKIDDLEHGKNPKRIRRFWRKLKDTLPFGEAIVLREFPALTMRVSQILNYVKQLERRGFYPGAIFIDYADLLVPEAGATGDDYQDAGSIYVELRSMAQKLNIPVWTAGQGNRSSLGKKVITMKELADSFKKAMHADVLIAICQTDEEEKRGNGRHFIMKNRNGRAHIEFPVRLDHARSTIINR